MNQFQLARDGRLSMPFYYDVDLSIKRDDNDPAFPPLVLNVAANSFFVDQDVANGGIATVTFQDTSFGQSAAPFTVSPGFTTKITFTQLKIENAAQPGKKMRFFYGVDLAFDPGQSGVITIAGGITLQQAGSITNSVFTASGPAITSQFLAASSTRKRFIARNSHPNTPMYLGGAGVVPTTGAIVVNPGDAWIETDSAAAAWYVYSAATAAIVLQEDF